MNRRDFTKASIMAGVGLTNTNYFGNYSNYTKAYNYNLNYAPHLGMFKNSVGDDPIDQINYMADLGFRAFEDNGMRSRSVALQNKISKTLENRGMKMGVFVAHKIYWDKPNLSSGDDDYRNEFLNFIKKSVEVAKRVNAKWMTVVPGHLDLRKDISYQTSNVVETLKRASDILEPHGLVMVLEPLNLGIILDCF